MKFSMEADALLNHGKSSEQNHEDIGTMIKNLIAAAEPLAKDFNGPAKDAFNKFKENSETVSQDLQSAHAAIMQSTGEQHKSFTKFQEEAGDMIASTAGAQNFDAATWHRG